MDPTFLFRTYWSLWAFQTPYRCRRPRQGQKGWPSCGLPEFLNFVDKHSCPTQLVLRLGPAYPPTSTSFLPFAQRLCSWPTQHRVSTYFYSEVTRTRKDDDLDEDESNQLQPVNLLLLRICATKIAIARTSVKDIISDSLAGLAGQLRRLRHWIRAKVVHWQFTC